MVRLVTFAAALVLFLAAAQAATGDDWQVFAADEAHFEAMFPDIPKPYVDQRIRNGVTVTSRVLAAGTPTFYCIAGYTEYSASIARGGRPELEAARDDFVDSSYATLLESRNVNLLRPPATMLQAVRFIAIADARRYTSIMAVEGTRFYHVVASSERFGFSKGDVARCLSGFKLTPES